MALKKFTIPPEQIGYTVRDGEETISTKLDGGKGRYRSDILNSTSIVTATWLFTRAQFEYFRAFYKGITDTAAQPFLIDLIIDEGVNLTEHTVHFIPNKIRITRVQGISFRVRAELEVEPEQKPEGWYEILVLFFEEFGEDEQAPVDLMNIFEQFINVDLPALPAFVP